MQHVSTLQERIIDPTTQETGSDAVQSIGAIVNETKAAIEKQDPQKLGQLMSENHERLQQLGVSHDVIDTLVDTAHQNNALWGESHRRRPWRMYDCPRRNRGRCPSFTRTIHETRSAGGLDPVAGEKGEYQMTSNIGITRAHTNIALIKYWGKENKELFIPMNSSLSLTLEGLLYRYKSRTHRRLN